MKTIHKTTDTTITEIITKETIITINLKDTKEDTTDTEETTIIMVIITKAVDIEIITIIISIETGQSRVKKKDIKDSHTIYAQVANKDIR